MKKTIGLAKLLLIFVFSMLITGVGRLEFKKTDQSCEQNVIYHVNKLIEDGKEVNVDVSVNVNPAEKTINMLANAGGATFRFDVIIESKSCDLDLSLKKGMAVYQTYLKGRMNASGTIKIKIEDGKLDISYLDEKQKVLRKFLVEKWEIVKN